MYTKGKYDVGKSVTITSYYIQAYVLMSGKGASSLVPIYIVTTGMCCMLT